MRLRNCFSVATVLACITPAFCQTPAQGQTSSSPRPLQGTDLYEPEELDLDKLEELKLYELKKIDLGKLKELRKSEKILIQLGICKEITVAESKKIICPDGNPNIKGIKVIPGSPSAQIDNKLSTYLSNIKRYD